MDAPDTTDWEWVGDQETDEQAGGKSSGAGGESGHSRRGFLRGGVAVGATAALGVLPSVSGASRAQERDVLFTGARKDGKLTLADAATLLCMGDNHGDVDSLERVVDGTEGEEFDFVIHVGDITNAWFDGVDEGREQLDAVSPCFETLHERGEFLYIWGNRDGAIGPEQPFQDYDLPGTFIPEDDSITVAGETFTQNPELVEDETILVNHYWHPELLEHFAGKAYFSGHIHTGRVQFVPDYWRNDCQFCYDEEEFYSEVVRTVLYGLGTIQEEAETDEVVESAASTFGATPPSFKSKLREFLEERTEEHS
ncbi:metallophosphoesterase family protein [Haloferax sp. Q22]|uniref:metallophosphoesterase family protein n=1 Tax=Haloferax sp. (strain Q22) TaxID=1526048 RepID=UPI000737C353|nr:metallophosphoesterase family protein [Haloferax sp. Q22]